MVSPSNPATDIKHVPAPWTLKGTIYTLATYITPSTAQTLSTHPSFLYAPLELASPFSHGKPVGGLGMIQVIRYTESPVGPYDELVIIPGKFEHEKGRNLRVTMIYVSQERTCWNGRMNWNIPKHLATFKFTTLPFSPSTISITVHPHILWPKTSTEIPATPESKPFFKATFKTIPYIPSFPLSTGIARYTGMNLALVQPPLPSGSAQNGDARILAGTEDWCSMVPLEWSKKCSVGWWDMRQGTLQQGKAEGEEQSLLDGSGNRAEEDTSEVENEREEGGEQKLENFWLGIGRWQVGVVMENATIEFPEGERW